jgi:hypothetical protein
MRRINKIIFPWKQMKLEMIYETKVSKIICLAWYVAGSEFWAQIPVVAQILKTRLLIHDTHKVCRKK